MENTQKINEKTAAPRHADSMKPFPFEAIRILKTFLSDAKYYKQTYL